jgi:hypothetical protein
MNRNNYIYTWQVNRNPFIDYPSLADYIFGANVGQPWFANLSTSNFNEDRVVVYPNPIQDKFTVSGLQTESTIEIYTNIGSKVFENNFLGETIFDIDLASGIYFAKITSEGKSVVKKVVVE